MKQPSRGAAITAITSDDDMLRAVIALAKQAKSAVGFLPDSAFRERAAKGTLLGAIVDAELAAFVLFDLPRKEVSIRQLVVDLRFRGLGLAKTLVDELAHLYRTRRGIGLSCRNDFPAHHMWPKLGFAPVTERPGRSISGKPLTYWWRDFGHATLFTVAETWESRPTAALDSSVFFDVVDQQRTSVADALRGDWLSDYVRLAITDEVLVEISNDKNDERRHRRHTSVNGFHQLSPLPEVWQPLLDELLAAHPEAPPTDGPDLRHVARAVAADASWLVTNDRSLKSRYSAAAELMGGLRIVLPDEFILELDAVANEDWYRPVDLAGTGVRLRQAGGKELAPLANRFVNHRAGETIGHLRSALGRRAQEPAHTRIQVVEVDDELRGLACFSETDSGLCVHMLRVTGGKGEEVIGRHLLAHFRELAIDSHLPMVRIEDEHLSHHVRRHLSSEGYQKIGDHHVAFPIRGTGSVDDLISALQHAGVPLDQGDLTRSGTAGLTAEQASELEARFHPYRLTGTPLVTFVVPIKAHWASALFDVHLASGQLFPRAWDLGLRRELVYYRSPKNAGGLAAPARLMWYVSGREPGGHSIRAVSLLNEVVVDRGDHLFRRYERLGVYSLSDVRERTDNTGQAMALRFSHTELLRHPVPLAEYKNIVSAGSDSKMPVLQSPQLITERTFFELYRFGNGGA